MDDHPRKNLRGYFTVDGRDITNEEVRRVVSYTVEIREALCNKILK